ncbi:MAG: hypothetical protein EXR20_05405 [Bacteroidetes bacterium]|nr:hypothetical protein [Bacteroidota bacterium]
MKNQDKEKEFNVIVKFTRETGYYETESVDLELPPLKGTDKTKEKIILKALSSLGLLNALSLEELVDKINLNEATISKLAKKSKSLKDFSLLVHKELVKNNIHSLRKYYEGRDGEPGITVKEVLECGDWMDMYGCKFEIKELKEESDYNNKIRQELFLDLCHEKKETEFGKEKKAIEERMRNVLLRVRETEDPIELGKLSTEFIDLSKELVHQENADFNFDRAYRFPSLFPDELFKYQMDKVFRNA